MKLKHIVNELDRRRGMLAKSQPKELFDYLFSTDDSLLANSKNYKIFTVARGYVRAQTKIKSESLVSSRMRNIYKSMGTVIFNKGSVVIIKAPVAYNSNGNIYVMYDFTKPAKNAEFLVGYILTDTLDPTRFYSPNTRYGFENTEKINVSMIAGPYQGKGYGKLLYDAVLKTTNAVYSDSTLFEGSFKMWIYHIRNNSKFFGIRTTGGLILPVFDDAGIEKSTKLDYNAGFVGIRKGIPSELTRLSKFLDGKNPDEVEVLNCILDDCNVDFMIEKIENSFTSEELMSNWDSTLEDKPLRGAYKNRLKKFEYAIVDGQDFVIAIKETPTGLAYILV